MIKRGEIGGVTHVCPRRFFSLSNRACATCVSVHRETLNTNIRWSEGVQKVDISGIDAKNDRVNIMDLSHEIGLMRFRKFSFSKLKCR